MPRKICRLLLGFGLFCIVTASYAAWAQTPLNFVPINPCRLVDTRLPVGPFGGPSITGGTSRNFNPIAGTSCSVPSTAQAYSFNITVVPTGNYLGYLTVWPAGTKQPVVSTLNSFDGRIKADATIIGGGTAGAVSVYATDTTDVVIDVTGYFVPLNVAGGLQFYPLDGTIPGACVAADTTQANGPLGGPSLAAGTARSFPISTSACLTSDPYGNLAQAYSVNITAVPRTTLGYLTVWNSDFAQPTVSTLNAPTGTTVSNAAQLLAASGDISAYPSDAIDLMISINGYWADPAAVGFSGLTLYTLTPCRALDTRTINSGAPVNGPYNLDVVGSKCIPYYSNGAWPQGYVFNATTVPTTKLAYLNVFDPSVGEEPVGAETLHALDAAVTSNFSLTTGNCTWYSCTENPGGSVNYDASSPAAVILDVNGFLDYADLRVVTASLPLAYDAIPYTATLTGVGGQPPYTWAVTGLPAGITANAKTGVISGTTTATDGLYPLTITLTDSAKTTVSTSSVSLNVAPLTGLQVNPRVLPNGTIGVYYDQFVSAIGGVQPYTWSVYSGSLPAGLNVTTTSGNLAEISGTPTAAGTNGFSLEVTDSQPKPATATAPFTITVVVPQ